MSASKSGRAHRVDEPSASVRPVPCLTCGADAQRVTVNGRSVFRCPWVRASERMPEGARRWDCSPRGASTVAFAVIVPDEEKQPGPMAEAKGYTITDERQEVIA